MTPACRTGADHLAAVIVAAGERVRGLARRKATGWLLTAPQDAMRIARDPCSRRCWTRTAASAGAATTLAAAAGERGSTSADRQNPAGTAQRRDQ